MTMLIAAALAHAITIAKPRDIAISNFSTNPGDEDTLNVRGLGEVHIDGLVIRGDAGKHMPLVIYKDPGQKMKFHDLYVFCGKGHTGAAMYFAANDMAISFCVNGPSSSAIFISPATSNISINGALFAASMAHKERQSESWLDAAKRFLDRLKGIIRT